MSRPGLLATVVIAAVTLSATQSAVAELRWPTWLGGKPEKISHAHSRTKKPTTTSTAAGKGGGNKLFTNTKNLFSPKTKPKTISKWPSENSTASRAPANADAKKSWLGPMFKSKEPEPPRSVEEWMDLKQIKP